MRLLPLILLFEFAVRQDDAVRPLVEKLRSDSVVEREDAARKLKDLGKAAVPALEKAAASADAEVAGKAKDLLRVIAVTERLTPELRKVMPGVEERIALGEKKAWTEAFLEAISRNSEGWRKYPSLRRRDLDVLLPTALEGANVPPETETLLLEACADRCLPSSAPVFVRLLQRGFRNDWNAAAWLSEMRARDAIPDVLRLLESKNSRVRYVAVSALGRLGSREVIPELLKRLKSEEDEVRIYAARALGLMGVPEALPDLVRLTEKIGGRAGWGATLGFKGLDGRPILPALRKLLKHENAGARQAAVELIGALRIQDAAPDLTRLLDGPDADLRSEVIRSLGRLNCKEAGARITEFLGDDDSYVRTTALSALSRLGERGAAPAIRKMLGRAEDRAAAAEALGGLGDTESIPALEALLGNSDGSSRSAATALASLGAKGSVDKIAKALKSTDSGTRYGACFALADLEAVEKATAVRVLLLDDEEFVRQGAARVLCRMGSLEGVAALLKAEAYLTWINAARHADVWRRLDSLKVPTPIEGTAREILEQVSKQAGLILECPADPFLDRWWMRISWESVNVLDAAADAAGAAYTIVLEPDRIRVVPHDDALEFWRKWLEEEERKRR
jgi:HEAT repeat protein